MAKQLLLSGLSDISIVRVGDLIVAIRADQSGWLVERPGLPHGTWHMVATTGASELVHLSRPADFRFATPEIWSYQGRIRASGFPGPYYGATLILGDSDTMELIAASRQGVLAHFTFSDACGWLGPVILPGDARGAPALIRSRFGRSGNLEVIVPRLRGGLSHFWRDNNAWREAVPPVSHGVWSGVALIHSNYDNLEFVGVCHGQLRHLWQAGPGGVWSSPSPIGTWGTCGRAALLQSSSGRRGHFEVVVAQSSGGLMYFQRDNDTSVVPWSNPTVFGQEPRARSQQLYDDVTLLETGSGRLEVMARVKANGRLLHFCKHPTMSWEQPIELLTPRGKYDE